ncbi:MAG: GH116 family glycosyl hydrolase [Candidatus Diapherotrites archaeon]|nr:GH116 family glycosyl hydrolase [Candidatus Diapherotrites archaeon]
MEKAIADALEIAKRDLRECYTESGILAGRGHFQQYWARDSFFASMGACAIGDFEQARKNFQLFFDLQDPKGLIPAVVSLKLKPKYKPFKVFSPPVDSNALFIIALADYARQSKDKVFIESNFKKISLAMEWLCKRDRDKDNLIEEDFFANWADTVLKHGEVLYSNCCYYHALKEFAFLADWLGVKMIGAEYEKRAETTKLALNIKFWENYYYTDWIGLTAHNYFASDGNVLAVAWDIATRERAERIEELIEKQHLDSVPMKTNFPSYPFWKVFPLLLPTRAYYYHNGFSWPWIGCMNAIALNKMGLKEKALLELDRLAWQINNYCVTNEVFDRHKKPVKSFWLNSERPFAWTAGLFLKAADEIIGLEEHRKKKIAREEKKEPKKKKEEEPQKQAEPQFQEKKEEK